jgi:hypothetical protein
VRDAVRDVAEQELLATGHAQVAYHDHVNLLFLDCIEYGLRGVSVGDYPRPSARTGKLLGEPAQFLASQAEV